MAPRIFARMIAITALSFIVVGLAGGAAAQIVLDNDVVIDWQNANSQPPVPAPLFGAPRLVRDWHSLRIKVAILSDNTLTSGVPSQLQLSFFREDFTRVCLLVSCAPLTLSFSQVPADGFDLGDFLSGGAVDDFIGRLPTPGILTINGRFFISGFATPQLTVTVSSDGNQIVPSRVGDVGIQAGQALDVPTRSIELARTLNEIETTWFRTRPVNLDAASPAGARIAVGFTHAFNFPADPQNMPIDRIDSAALRLRLANSQMSVSTDFILLDRGVRRVNNKGRQLPVVFLRDLAPPTSAGTSKDFIIELAEAPVSFISPDDPMVSSAPQILDLTGDLKDGRLNVIVAGRSTVDYSDLTVRLKE